MNKAILSGRLTRDPDVRYSQGEDQSVIARYTLAVDRRVRRTGNENQKTADFISCVAFGKNAEFAEKYFTKGMKINVSGRIQTGSYKNRDGQTVYTTDVVIEEQEFGESKNSDGSRNEKPLNDRAFTDPAAAAGNTTVDGFMNIPDGIDEELPFS